MTTSPDRPLVEQDPFAFLASHAFVVLTTYRKNGTPVPTTIWFAYHQGNVYFTTQKHAGKSKRIRNDGLALLTPSDRIGHTLDLPQVQGHAAELQEAEYETALSVLKQKYGQQFDQITSGSDSSLRTYFVIHPATA